MADCNSGKFRRIICLAVIGMVFAVPVFLLCASAVQHELENWKMRLPFDSTGWKSGQPDTDIMWPARLRMVDDLMASRRLMGLNRGEVGALLGNGAMSVPGRNAGNIAYVLGPERGMIRIDSETLVITFDADGRVSGWHIERD